MLQKKAQTYNDGVCSIYVATNTAAAGKMPVNGLAVRVSPLRFENRVIGFGRFWAAKQQQVKLGRLIRTPRVASVEADDIVALPEGVFEIKQIQYPPDVEPPSMDLSLERTKKEYTIPGPEGADDEG